VVRLLVLPPGGDRTLESGPKSIECDGVEVTGRMPLRRSPEGEHHGGVPPNGLPKETLRAPEGVLVGSHPKGCSAVKEPEHTREEPPREEAPGGELRDLRRRTLR
jgi:hypothetical protein